MNNNNNNNTKVEYDVNALCQQCSNRKTSFPCKGCLCPLCFICNIDNGNETPSIYCFECTQNRNNKDKNEEEKVMNNNNNNKDKLQHTTQLQDMQLVMSSLQQRLCQLENQSTPSIQHDTAKLVKNNNRVSKKIVK